MELSKIELNAVKRTAKVVASLEEKIEKLQSKIEVLSKEIEGIEATIVTWESPIVERTGQTSQNYLNSLEVVPEKSTVSSTEIVNDLDDNYNPLSTVEESDFRPVSEEHPFLKQTTVL